MNELMGRPTRTMRNTPSPAFRGIVLPALLLVAIAVVAYANSFHVPLLFDDVQSIAGNKTIRAWSSALLPPPATGLTVAGRPLLNFSFAVNHAIGGLDPRGYHVVNLGLHIVAGLLLFGFLRRTLLLPAWKGVFDARAAWLAATVAAIWIAHPLQTESVTYVSQRAESLVGVFYLLTLYAFVRAVASPHPGRWYALTLIACLLGMASKEVMTTAPLIVLLYDRTFVAGSFAVAWRTRGRVYSGLAATWILLGVLVWSTGNRGGTAGFGLGVTPWSYALTQAEAIVRYLGLAFWPEPLVLDHGTRVAGGIGDVVPQLVVIATLLAGTAFALVRRHWLGFAGAWFFVILAPSSSIVPVVSQTIAEHRMYLPLAALAALAIPLVGRLASRRNIAAAGVFGLVVLALAALTFRRNHDYRSAEAIWQDTIAKRPDNPRPHIALAIALQAEGRLDEAVAEFEKGLAISPANGAVHGALGNVLFELARLPEAIVQFETALRLDARDARALTSLGNVYLAQGRIADALSRQQAAASLAPEDAEVRYNLGNTLAAAGRFADAAAAYREALGLEPDMLEARSNLANSLAIAGDLNGAIAEFRAITAAHPQFADVWSNLGDALAQAGRAAEAAWCYEKALAIDPVHEAARVGLTRTRGR
jgi:tetratricopeptide (TPR) repeat protein